MVLLNILLYFILAILIGILLFSIIPFRFTGTGIYNNDQFTYTLEFSILNPALFKLTKTDAGDDFDLYLFSKRRTFKSTSNSSVTPPSGEYHDSSEPSPKEHDTQAAPPEPTQQPQDTVTARPDTHDNQSASTTKAATLDKHESDELLPEEKIFDESDTASNKDTDKTSAIDTPNESEDSKEAPKPNRLARLKKTYAKWKKIYDGGSPLVAKVVRWFTHSLKRFLSILSFERGSVTLSGSFGDPAQTGKIAAFIMAFSAAAGMTSKSRFSLSVNPDFSGTPLSGEAAIAIRTSFAMIIFPFVAAMITLPFISGLVFYFKYRKTFSQS